MNRWVELNHIALLGTQRAPLPDWQDETPLGQLAVAMADALPEQVLLQLAGTLDLYQQVGRGPQRAIQPPDSHSPTPAADVPSCSPALADRLAGMLDGRFRDLLQECLAAMAAAQLRIPAALMPDFLQRGQKTALLRPFLLPVLGENGRWLAAQNPAWAYASPAATTEDGLRRLWRDGDRSERLALLRQLRHAQPNLGLNLAASTWKAEPSSNRAAFIRLLEIGLSMADEPFLEAALDDRELQVRRKAAELLACLPQSHLCQRMITNSEQILSYNPAHPIPITPTFPIPLNDEMVRDGVPQLDTQLTGNALARARARQLTAVVAAIPLDYWTMTWQAAPETIVLAVLKSRWPRTLTQALALAAQRQRHVDWALALAKTADFKAVALKLVPVITPEAGRELLHHFLQAVDDGSTQLNKDSPLLKILRYWPHDWDRAQAMLWIDFMARQMEVDEKPTPFLRAAVKQLARACRPDCAEDVITTVIPFREAHPTWRIVLNEMISILRFRREMYAEIGR